MILESILFVLCTQVNFLKLTKPNTSCLTAANIEILSIQRHIWPLLLEHPKDKIFFYISNADALMKYSLQIIADEPVFATNTLSKAEHNMTLVVNELRKLQNTSLIPYSMLFQAFKRQNEILLTTGNYTLIDISRHNEKTAKTVYYNGLPADTKVVH